MKKLLASFIAMTFLVGPVELAQEAHQGPFKLGIQQAHAYTLDHSNVLSAKKKSKKKKKTKKSKKGKKSKKRKKSSKVD